MYNVETLPLVELAGATNPLKQIQMQFSIVNVLLN